MYRLQSKFLVLLSVVAVMGNWKAGICSTGAYQEVIQIYNLMAGSQGIKTTSSTPQEITNLTHIAIGAASSMQEAGFISALIKHSQTVLSTPNTPVLEHYKVLIVLYFATKNFEKNRNIYDVCVGVSNEIQRINGFDGTNLREIKSGLTAQIVGKILTDYQFELIYSYIKQNPNQKLDAKTIIDYLGNPPQFQPASAVPAAPRAPSLTRVPSAPVAPSLEDIPAAPGAPGGDSTAPAAAPPIAPTAPPSPSKTDSPRGGVDFASQLAAAKLKSTSTTSSSSTAPASSVSPSAASSSPSRQPLAGANAGQAGLAASAAASLKTLKKITIPTQESNLFFEKIKGLMSQITAPAAGSSGGQDHIKDLKNTLCVFISAHKQEALTVLSRWGDLKVLRKIDEIRDILVKGFETKDPQEIINALSKAQNPS